MTTKSLRAETKKRYERWKICRKKKTKLISTKSKVNKDLQMGGKISLVAEEDLEVTFFLCCETIFNFLSLAGQF